MKIQALLGITLVCLTALAHGELVWDKTELDLKPGPNDETAVGNFKYQNKGDKPVHINNVRTSCGCTTAALQKNDVAPGEKGEIVATLKIGDRSGLQTKIITVESDDPKQPSTALTLRASITPALELQPAFVYWQGNEEPKPKTIVAVAAKEAGIKNIEVVSSTPEITAEVSPGDAAGAFKISIRPKDTSKPSGATLTIKPDAASNIRKTFYARAQVTAAPRAIPAATAH